MAFIESLSRHVQNLSARAELKGFLPRYRTLEDQRAVHRLDTLEAQGNPREEVAREIAISSANDADVAGARAFVRETGLPQDQQAVILAAAYGNQAITVQELGGSTEVIKESIQRSVILQQFAEVEFPLGQPIDSSEFMPEPQEVELSDVTSDVVLRIGIPEWVADFE